MAAKVPDPFLPRLGPGRSPLLLWWQGKPRRTTSTLSKNHGNYRTSQFPKNYISYKSCSKEGSRNADQSGYVADAIETVRE